jgi:hypothetical protein
MFMEVGNPATVGGNSTEPANVGALVRALRPARVLIGWTRLDEGALTLAAREPNAVTDEHRDRVRAAREVVLGRAEGIDQDGLISHAPIALRDHIAALKSHPVLAAYLAEGWDVAVADLTRVCAMQPFVFTDSALDRVRDVEANDMADVCRLSLPIPEPAGLRAQFDSSRQAWMFSSRNPNLRINGQFSGSIGPGALAYGFVVSVSPSFMQVAGVRGRYVLRDGYHRAYGFLRRGIGRVPVLYREYGALEDLGLHPGMLPQEAYLGTRPARLVDYLDDEVSTAVDLPASQKMVVIQGMEMTPLG